jgi:hypothetical protein
MLAKQSPSPNIGFPMAFRRLLPVLCTLLLLAGSALAADKPLTIEDVVAKARAALASDPAALTKVKTLRMEFASIDEKGKSPSSMTLTLAAPTLRHQRSLDDLAAVAYACRERGRHNRHRNTRSGPGNQPRRDDC